MKRSFTLSALLFCITLCFASSHAQVMGVRRVTSDCDKPTKVGAVQVDWGSMFYLSAASPQQESSPIPINRSCEELRVGVVLDQAGWDFDADVYGFGSDSANPIPVLLGTIRSTMTLRGISSGSIMIEGGIPDHISVRIKVKRGPNATTSDVSAKYVIWGSRRNQIRKATVVTP